MPSPNHIGAFEGFSRQPGSIYKVARNGLATYDESWIGRPTSPYTITQGSVSDRHPNVVLLDWTISNYDGGRIKIDYHYEGKATGTSEDVIADRVIDSATSTAPIDTNPRFSDIIAADTSNEIIVDGKAVIIFTKSGAVFEKVSKKFLYFTTYLPDVSGEPDFATINPKAGIANYKQPSATYTESIIETSWPDFEMLGYIDEPSGDPPTPPTGKNWLLDKIRSRNIADTYFETQRVWVLSGPRGWDEDFYSPPTP